MNQKTRRPCVKCGARTVARSGTCPTCEATLDGGRWVGHCGIQHWVPDGETLATHTLRRRRYLELTRERYATPTWWHLPLDREDPARCRARLDAALAEADHHDVDVEVAA